MNKVVGKYGILLLFWVVCAVSFGQAINQEAPLFSFVQLSDPQVGMGGIEHDEATLRQSVKQINASGVDFALICGDMVEGPSAHSFESFKIITSDFKVPVYYAAGNHDVYNAPTKKTLALYRRYFGPDYYAFEHKGITFLTVNTMLWKNPLKGESKKQMAWLKTQLKRASYRYSPVIIVGHIPLFLKSPDEKEGYFNQPPKIRKQLLDMFEKNGVVAVLTGHTHKRVENQYHKIQMMSNETTSLNFDKRPMAYHVWTVYPDGKLKKKCVELKGPFPKQVPAGS